MRVKRSRFVKTRLDNLQKEVDVKVNTMLNLRSEITCGGNDTFPGTWTVQWGQVNPRWRKKLGAGTNLGGSKGQPSFWSYRLVLRWSVQKQSQPHNQLTGFRTPFHLIVSHELFLLAMCLHGNLMCYVLNKDYRCCVKSTQLRLTGVRTPSHLIVSHEHFLLAMCLHGGLICYVC